MAAVVLLLLLLLLLPQIVAALPLPLHLLQLAVVRMPLQQRLLAALKLANVVTLFVVQFRDCVHAALHAATSLH